MSLKAERFDLSSFLMVHEEQVGYLNAHLHDSEPILIATAHQ